MKSQTDLDKEYFDELKQPLRQRSICEIINNKKTMKENTQKYRVTIFGCKEFSFQNDNGGDISGFTWYAFTDKGKRLKFTSKELLDGIDDILPYDEWDFVSGETGIKQFYLQGVKRFDAGDCLELEIREDFDWNRGIPKFRLVS